MLCHVYHVTFERTFYMINIFNSNTYIKVSNTILKEALDKATILTTKLIKIKFFMKDSLGYIDFCKIISNKRLLKSWVH